MLGKWWEKKYKLPSNHNLFVSRTLFDLLVEFYEDYFDRNPMEVHRQADGQIQFKDTGDPLIDKWEQQIADGIEPNLDEAFSEHSLKALEKVRAKYPISDTMTIGDVAERAEREKHSSTVNERSGWDNTSLFGDGSD